MLNSSQAKNSPYVRGESNVPNKKLLAQQAPKIPKIQTEPDIFWDSFRTCHAEITRYKKDASFFLSPHLSWVWPWICQSRGTEALCHEDPKAGKETFEHMKYTMNNTDCNTNHNNTYYIHLKRYAVEFSCKQFSQHSLFVTKMNCVHPCSLINTFNAFPSSFFAKSIFRIFWYIYCLHPSSLASSPLLSLSYHLLVEKSETVSRNVLSTVSPTCSFNMLQYI